MDGFRLKLNTFLWNNKYKVSPKIGGPNFEVYGVHS